MTPSTPPETPTTSIFKKILSPWEERLSFFSKKGKVFRWAVFLGVLSLSVFGLLVFLGSVVEPRIGLNLRGETTDVEAAAAPILEKMAVLEKTEKRPETLAVSSPFSLVQREERAPSPAPQIETQIEGILNRLQALEGYLHHFLIRESGRKNVWAAFLLLRQDVRQEAPFAQTLHHLNNLLPKRLRGSFDSLQPFAQQGVWSFGKIVTQFSGSYFLALPEKTGIWGSFTGFFKKLWVIRRTDAPQSPFEKTLQEAQRALRQGHVEKTLSLLQMLPLSPDPAAQEWMTQAQKFTMAEKAFDDFEKNLFEMNLWETD